MPSNNPIFRVVPPGYINKYNNAQKNLKRLLNNLKGQSNSFRLNSNEKASLIRFINRFEQINNKNRANIKYAISKLGSGRIVNWNSRYKNIHLKKY